VSLQQEVREEDAAVLATRTDIRHFGAQLNDFADTAALVELMDVVVTVCTSAAHLAGAMGKPVWILLCFNPCWRWLLDRDDSPWYPTARLFRQPAIGDWESVIEVVGRELRQHISVCAATPGLAPDHNLLPKLESVPLKAVITPPDSISGQRATNRINPLFYLGFIIAVMMLLLLI